MLEELERIFDWKIRKGFMKNMVFELYERIEGFQLYSIYIVLIVWVFFSENSIKISVDKKNNNNKIRKEIEKKYRLGKVKRKVVMQKMRGNIIFRKKQRVFVGYGISLKYGK